MEQMGVQVFTMFNASTYDFNKPDDTKEISSYSWSDSNYKVDSWCNWTRAVSYYLKDKLGFQISGGGGGSLGVIGNVSIRNSNEIPYGTFCNDNDWTNNDEKGKYGIYPIDVKKVTVEADGTTSTVYVRQDSPFKPIQDSSGKYHYTEMNNGNPVMVDGELKWNGQWNSQRIFDDENNRFDIKMTLGDFDDLGIRIKYPLTNTGASQMIGDSGVNTHYRSYYYLVPGLVPVNNNKQIALMQPGDYVSDLNTTELEWGFITKLRPKYDNYGYFCVTQHYTPNYQAYSRDGIDDSSQSLKYYTWTSDLFNKLSSNRTEALSLFKQYNTLICYQSKDKSCLNIIIADNNRQNKLLELCFYKNYDNTSGLLIAEDSPQFLEHSRTWIKDGAHYRYNSYGDFRSVNLYNLIISENKDSGYGNYGNIVVSSNSALLEPYRPTPIMYFKSVRIDSYGILSDNKGYWRLEKFCPLPNSGTYTKDLYLVTSAGSTELINKIKYITGYINGKKVKFLVWPFNSPVLEERGSIPMTRNSYGYPLYAYDSNILLAMPVEIKEEG